MLTRFVRRPLGLGLSALLLATLAVLVPVAPAQAHDRLVSSDPESGATLDSAPEEIGLTFSANVQDIGGSVDLTDADGEKVSVGSPEVDGTTVTTAVEDDLSAGDYEVRWRVVSSDGHAISGVVDFTVEGDEGSSDEGSSDAGSDSASSSSEFSQAPTSSDAETSSPESSGTSDEASESAGSEEESGTSPAMLLLAAGVVVVVLGAGAVLLRSRRRGDD